MPIDKAATTTMYYFQATKLLKADIIKHFFNNLTKVAGMEHNSNSSHLSLIPATL